MADDTIYHGEAERGSDPHAPGGPLVRLCLPKPRIFRVLAVAAAVATLSACVTGPVAVTRLAPKAAYRNLRANTLSTGAISSATRNVLRRHDLLVLFDDDPERAIAELRSQALAGKPSPDQLAALAETSFAYGMASEKRSHFFAAAIYAYALLFPDSPDDDLNPIDPRMQVGTDTYNAAIVRALIDDDGQAVKIASGKHALPFGTLDISFDEKSLLWSDSVLADFIPATELGVSGLRNRYRRWGIGAPLAARAVQSADADIGTDYVPPNARISVTTLLRIENVGLQLAGRELTASLELYTPTDAEETQIGRQTLPLESEPTVALAVALAETRPWQHELTRFLGGVITGPDGEVRLTALTPPKSGRIPVIFVHGTNSSPSRWANMVNDLNADRRIRNRFDFYFFAYDSGNPISYSGDQLRRKLDELHTNLATLGVGECADHMVVIGHSQGGLLAKLTVVDSGNVFWSAVSRKPFEKVRISSRNRELIRNAMFFEARPYIDRVVFIATPHRGSYLAGSGIAQRIAQRLIQVPTELVSFSADMLQLREDPDAFLNMERVSTSIDNMSPGNTGLQLLSKLPIKAGVAAHSIIAIKKAGPLEEGKDGVVAYSSAHIDGVESELVVLSNHSTQSNAHTINEVERILQLHAEATSCGAHAAARDQTRR